MELLKEKNPYVYGSFMNGYHVVHRSNNSFSGISADMVIEQTVMRDTKRDGQLTWIQFNTFIKNCTVLIQ